MISKSCSYGIQATLYIASQQREGFVPIREISEQLGISYHFLTKVLQILTRHNLMHSLRGPQGGVALTRSAEQMTLKDIIIAIDGPELFTECVLGLPDCGTARPCPLHDAWKEVRGRIDEGLAQNTIADVLAQSERIDALLRCGQGAATKKISPK